MKYQSDAPDLSRGLGHGGSPSSTSECESSRPYQPSRDRMPSSIGQRPEMLSSVRVVPPRFAFDRNGGWQSVASSHLPSTPRQSTERLSASKGRRLSL